MVDATIQALPADEVGRAFNDNTFRWTQEWRGQSTEIRRFYMGKRLMGVVTARLDSGDHVHLEAELMTPEQPEELVARDPSQFAPGQNVMSIQRKPLPTSRIITSPTVAVVPKGKRN